MMDASASALIESWWGLRFTIAFGDPQGWVFDRPPLTLAMRCESLAAFKKATEAVARLCFANDSRADGRRLLEIVLPSEIIPETLQATISWSQHDELEIIVKTLEMVLGLPPRQQQALDGGVALEIADADRAEETHLSADIQAELDVSDNTLRRFATAAGVAAAKQGKRGRRYTATERRQILEHVAAKCATPETVRRAEKALQQTVTKPS